LFIFDKHNIPNWDFRGFFFEFFATSPTARRLFVENVIQVRLLPPAAPVLDWSQRCDTWWWEIPKDGQPGDFGWRVVGEKKALGSLTAGIPAKYTRFGKENDLPNQTSMMFQPLIFQGCTSCKFNSSPSENLINLPTIFQGLLLLNFEGCREKAVDESEF